MTFRITPLDNDLNFDDEVRARMAANLSDPSTIEGAALAALYGGGLTLDDLVLTLQVNTPSSVWTIYHSLPFRPNVTITDSAGTVVLTEIKHITPNMIQSTSFSAFSGVVHLS